MSVSTHRSMLSADWINPFVSAASDVLTAELGEEPQRGTLRLLHSPASGQEVTALIGITGEISGIVLLGLSVKTARLIAGRILGQPFAELDDLAQSGIAEVGNVIVGRATTLMAVAGYASTISPPALFIGSGAVISTLDRQRLVIPLHTFYGDVELQVSLEEHAA